MNSVSLRQQLQFRAQLLHRIRQFFLTRDVIEVETPLLCQFTVTDIHTHSFTVPVMKSQDYYLQTSPEYAMKRLLAAGSGCIYQISKAFRYGERGGKHNPEFTMLEWYRLGYDHYQLMDEFSELLQEIAHFPPAHSSSYQAIFLQYYAIDIFQSTVEELQSQVIAAGLPFAKPQTLDFDDCLQLLLDEFIENKWDRAIPLFIYDFPVSQAALAKIHQQGAWSVAARFELYINGVEIANGFHELTDANEQMARFTQDQEKRRQLGLAVPAIDSRFIAALPRLPDCAGVAVGIDRLLMALISSQQIDEIMPFPWEQA